MLRLLPSTLLIVLAASGAAFALSEDEAATIRCAAAGLVLSGTLGDFVAAGADLSEDYLNVVEQAALDLLLDAEPLFEADAANAEMGRVVDAMMAEANVAIEDGRAAGWMQEATDEVRLCHMASPRWEGPAQ